MNFIGWFRGAANTIHKVAWRLNFERFLSSLYLQITSPPCSRGAITTNHCEKNHWLDQRSTANEMTLAVFGCH